MARELKITITADGAQAKRELGDVETKIDGVEKSVGSADKAVAGMSVNLTTVTKVLAGVAGVMAGIKIAETTKQVVDAASKIADTSQKLGIGAEAVQRLGFALSQSGSSLQSLGVGLARMADAITRGTTQTQRTVADLGLSLDQLRRLKPEEAFLVIAEAIRAVPDPMRQSAAATRLFGETGAEFLPAIKAGLVAVGEQAPIMSAAMIQSADVSGDRINLLTQKIDNLRAQALIPLADFFTSLPSKVQIGAAGLMQFLPSIESFLLLILAFGGPAGALAKVASAAKVMWAALLGPVGMLAGAAVALKLFADQIRATMGDEQRTLIDNYAKSMGGANQAIRDFQGLPALNPNAKDIELTAPPSAAAAGATGLPFQPIAAGAEAAAEKVTAFEQSVRNLVDRIGGGDMITAVNTWIEAIDRVGGIGALTRTELDQFTQAVADAVEKMLLLGQVVPASWLAIANTIRTNPLLGATQDMLGQSLQMMGGINRQQLLLPSSGPSQGELMALANAVPQALMNQNISATVTPHYVSQMGQVFTGVAAAIPGLLQQAFTGGGGVVGAFKAAGSMLGSGIATGVLGAWDSSKGMITNGLLSGFKGWFGQFVASAIPVVGALLGPLMGKIGGFFKGLFGGGEEGTLVNPARDQFLAQFGPGGTGIGSGFHNLAAQLTEITGEEGGGSLFRALTSADTMPEFNAAVSAINQALAGTARTSEQGIDGVTDSALGLNLALTGSDDAIRQLGETQDRVVNAMLAGFDKLMAKLDAFVAALGGATGMVGELGASVPGVSSPTQPTFIPTPDSGSERPGAGLPIKEPDYDAFPVYHSGGLVKRWLYAHGGLNLRADEVPIIAQTGERVLSRRENAAYERQEMGGGVHLHLAAGAIVVKDAKNADALADQIVPKLMQRIGRYNQGGSRRQLRTIAGTT